MFVTLGKSGTVLRYIVTNYIYNRSQISALYWTALENREEFFTILYHTAEQWTLYPAVHCIVKCRDKADRRREEQCE